MHPQNNTTWGSANAEDMYRIATRLAGFDAVELMLEIGQQQRDPGRSTSLPTVLRAMGVVSRRMASR